MKTTTQARPFREWANGPSKRQVDQALRELANDIETAAPGNHAVQRAVEEAMRERGITTIWSVGDKPRWGFRMPWGGR